MADVVVASAPASDGARQALEVGTGSTDLCGHGADGCYCCYIRGQVHQAVAVVGVDDEEEPERRWNTALPNNVSIRATRERNLAMKR